MQDAEASAPLTIADKAKVLDAFSRALDREAHNLRQWPELTWQQLYNGLQWEPNPLRAALAAEAKGRRSRGASWMRLRTSSSDSEVRTLAGHTDRVVACAVSPDGSFIVSASLDGSLRIWDANTGGLRATLAGHGESVNACAISSDSSFIVSASRDKTLRVWDIFGRCLRILAGHTGFLSACSISPDGTWIISGGADGVVKIWNTATGGERSSLQAHAGGVAGCAISRDGMRMVSWGQSTRDSEEPCLKIWDVSTINRPTVLDFPIRPPYGSAHALAISPDSTFLALGWAPRTSSLRIRDLWRTSLDIWDLRTGEYRATPGAHSDGITKVVVSPDGSFIVSSSRDGTLKIWNAKSGTEHDTLRGHGHWVQTCAIDPTGRLVVSGGSDRTLKVWDIQTGEEMATLRGHSDEITDLAVSPDGESILSSSTDGTLKIWRLYPPEERL